MIGCRTLRKSGTLVDPGMGQSAKTFGPDKVDGGVDRAVSDGSHISTIDIVPLHYERSILEM